MTAESISRWARKFVLTSAAFLVIWQIGIFWGIPQRTGVVLGVYGFVLHMIFGKGYSLIPSYFNRQLRVPWAPPVHLACTLAGTSGLTLGTLGSIPAVVGQLGAVLWLLGVVVFLSAIGWTIRDNPTGRDTGTSDANAARRPVDRLANAFMPVAMAYLLLGSYETLALLTRVPGISATSAPGVSHLLAAGTAAMLVFAIGFRLLPRFLVATPPRPMVFVVLFAGAAGPLLLARSFGHGWMFQLGGILEAVAVLGFGATYLVLFRRSDRRQIGFYGVLIGAGCGAIAVLLGVSFAFNGITGGLVAAHFRLNVLGFLGLTIVGIAYQFYPPSVGSFRGASDRTALWSIIALGGGVFVEAVGLSTGVAVLVSLGRLGTVGGAVVYAGLIAGLFYDRYY